MSTGGGGCSCVLNGSAVPTGLSIAGKYALISSPLALSFSALLTAFLESTG